MLGVEAKGHGIFDRFHSTVWNGNDFKHGHGMVYLPWGSSGVPLHLNDRNVSYALMPFNHPTDGLWNRRGWICDDVCPFVSDGVIGGDCTDILVVWGACLDNQPHAPWKMDDGGESSPSGEWFEAPAEFSDLYLDNVGSYSVKYVYRSVGEVIEPYHYDAGGFSRIWWFRKPGASQVSVHFDRIDLGAQAGDRLELVDSNAQVRQTFVGASTNQWSTSIPGDTVGIRLTTAHTVWGFYADHLA
jgi:hypothetical protein